MMALFGFLLFWFGFLAAVIGTPVIALKATSRMAATGGAFVYFMMCGAILMGTAGVNFSYTPPPLASLPVAIILWLTLMASLLVAVTRPPLTKNSQENTLPPK